MNNRIQQINFAEAEIIRNNKYKQERQRYVTDILKGNSFASKEINGPYNLILSIANNKLVFDLTNINNEKACHNISLMPLRKIMKDYYIICDSYIEAVRISDLRKIEAIDMGRRGVHNEGAEILTDNLIGQITMDFETARNFFSLISILNVK